MNQYPGARPSREAGALSSNCPDESEVLRNQQRILFHSFTFCITLSLEKVNSFAYSKFSRRKFTTREEGVWFPPMKWLPNQWCTIWLCVCVCVCVYVCACSVMSNFLWPPWTVAHQAPLSMEFPRQEYWIGLPFPTPGYLPNPGIKWLLLTVENDVSKLDSEHIGVYQVPFKGGTIVCCTQWFWLPVFWYIS